MKLLIINSGSSSLKYKLIDMPSKKTLLYGHVDAIGLDRCEVKITVRNKTTLKKCAVKDHIEATIRALESLKKNKVIKSYNEIDAVGHRVVHGGEYYNHAVKIDQSVINNIKKLCDFAPLHNPSNLAGILTCKKILRNTLQYAVFDTAFHQTIPSYAFRYGIPNEFYVKYGIRKYGFHGISHKYLADKAYTILGDKKKNIITCHLGNGSSITAIKNGKSIDTTMGFTPMDGLMMGTRSGEIDPEIPLYLMKKRHYTPEDMEFILNSKSGLLGISEETSDIRDIRSLALKGDKNARLALKMLAYKIAFYISGYAGILGGTDAIIFSGGIGEHAWFIRKDVLDNLQGLGIDYDREANKNNEIIISTKKSKIKIFIIPSNEELEIAKEIYKMI